MDGNYMGLMQFLVESLHPALTLALSALGSTCIFARKRGLTMVFPYFGMILDVLRKILIEQVACT